MRRPRRPVAVLDSGWQEGAANTALLAGGRHWRDGGPVSGSPQHITPYAGHGTFVAGLRGRCAEGRRVGQQDICRRGARSSLIWSRTYPMPLRRAWTISLDFGSNTRRDIASLGFDVVGELLQNYPGVALVAAAGNDSSPLPFWPAAFPWAVGVGALSAELAQPSLVQQLRTLGGRVRAWRGTGQRVRDPEEYTCTEPPNVGQVRNFAWHVPLERNVLLDHSRLRAHRGAHVGDRRDRYPGRGGAAGPGPGSGDTRRRTW